MEGLIGIALALGVALFAAVAGFERERGFYPMLLLVIASYYPLFAVIGGSPAALAVDAAVLGGFAILAVAGLRRSLWIVVAALAAHAALDLVHARLAPHSGAPAWWPPFCMGFDLAAAAWLALRLRRAGALRPEVGR